MPIFPLYTPSPPAPDGCHHVRAPGGYEWWRFEAEDIATKLRLVITFYDGFAFDPAYRVAYERYRRRPTRNPPPVPRQYPRLTVAIYENGQFTPSETSAPFAVLSNGAAIGGNSFQKDGQSFRVRIAMANVDAELVLRAVIDHPAGTRQLASRNQAGADHFLVGGGISFQAQGVLRRGGAPPQSIQGLGFHEHRYGSGPLLQGIQRWFTGRVLMQDRAASIWMAGGSVYLAEMHDAAVQECEQVPADVRWPRGAEYPVDVRVGEVLLTNGKVICRSGVQLQLMYEALVRGEKGVAYCEVVAGR